MSRSDLAGKRVLVVEDEWLVATAVEDILVAAGCGVVGPFARVADALAAVRTEPMDVALLDVNVAGEKVFPVAHALEKRGVPFLFVTGYGQAALPPEHPHWAVEMKPFRSEHLLRSLVQRIRPG